MLNKREVVDPLQELCQADDSMRTSDESLHPLLVESSLPVKVEFHACIKVLKPVKVRGRC